MISGSRRMRTSIKFFAVSWIVKRVVLAIVTISTLCLILTVGVPATAVTCICLPSVQVIAPADGAVDVPVNARLWMGDSDSGPWLTDATGQEVPGTVSSLRSMAGIVRVFTPDAPLTPGATYIGSGSPGETIFTVGTDTDTTPPLVPSVTSREQFFGDTSCGGSGDDRVLTLGIADRAVVTLVDINRSSNLNPSVPEGPISVVADDGEMVHIGKSPCTRSWEGVGDIGVRLGSFDVAGNFSGWSEESPETVETGGCTCTASTMSYSDAWLLLCALGLGLLRRRRRFA